MTDRRTALFDAIRPFAPDRKFLTSHIQVIDALADAFGIQRMDARKTSATGRNLIRDFEGERLTAYPDPGTGGDPWTIGVGHTGPDVHKGLTITKEQSDKLLSEDLARFEAGVNKLAPKTTQAQFDALVSFSYNLGTEALRQSTLLKKVNAWKMWVLCDRPPIKNWSKGKVTLLGDAAHPMLQYLAQGANMALEDGVCLAEQVVAFNGDYERAFKKYQELRYLRTARVQLTARMCGEIYHASGVSRELRNQVLSEWSAQGGVDMSWLYGHQAHLPRVERVEVPKQHLKF